MAKKSATARLASNRRRLRLLGGVLAVAVVRFADWDGEGKKSTPPSSAALLRLPPAC